MLSGYKTQIAAVLAILGAIGAFMTGEMALADAAQIVVTAVIGSFLRMGVASK